MNKNGIRVYVLISLFLLLGFASQSGALTLSEIRAQVRIAIKDTSATRQRYADSTILDFTNEIQRDFVNRTWSVERSTGFVLSQNTTYYNLPDNMIAIQFAYFTNQSGQIQNLDEEMERTLRQLNPDFETEGGPPTNYIVRTSTKATVQLEFGIYPVPNTASSTGTIRIDYFSQVTDLAADSDIPFEGYKVLFPYHYALIYGVAGKIMTFEHNITMAQAYFEIYNDLLNISSNRLGRAPNYVPSFRAGPPRRLRGR